MIQKLAQSQKRSILVHIPLMTKQVDHDFVVKKLLDVEAIDVNVERHFYHIDVSSDAGMDVNTLLFKLLVLRHVNNSNGESFNVSGN